MADQKVEFTDTQGRKCLFKLNTSGALDYYVDGRQKVSQIKDLTPAGNAVAFEGKRLMFTEKDATIKEEDSEEVIDKLMKLSNKAADAAGTLTNSVRCLVQVLKAEGVRAADDCGTSDPYVVVGIPGKPKSNDQTSIVQKTLNPTWNEYVEVHDYCSGDPLEFKVMDFDYLTSDDFLGYATLPSNELAAKQWEGALRLGDDGDHGSISSEISGKLFVKVLITTGEVSKEIEEAMASLQEKKQQQTPEVDAEEGEANSRKDVVVGLCKVLVPEGSKAVDSNAMRQFAQCYGFHGDDAEWGTEWKELCKASGWKETGPDLEQFAGWVDKKVDFWDDIVLGQVLDEFRKRVATPKRVPRFMDNTWEIQDVTAEQMSQKTRDMLITDVFKALGGGSPLSSNQMWSYASFCGFDGVDDEWKIEFEELAKEFGFAVGAGVSAEHFKKVVDNEGEGTWSSQNEFRELLDILAANGEGLPPMSTLRGQVWLLHEKTQAARSHQPRKILIQRIFNALDERSDGFLGPDELRKYAEQCGFEGDDDAWAIEYAEMCNDYNLNARKGADLKQFEKIFDKKAGQASIEAQDLVDLIEDTKIGVANVRTTNSEVPPSRAMVTQQSFKRKMSQHYTSRLSRAISRKKTWVAVSRNFEVLRSFSVFLRARYSDTDAAFEGFSKKPFGRLTKADFLKSLERLEYDGDSESLFRLLALGSTYIVKRHIKWAWNLLMAEELVRARAQRRATLRQRIDTLRAQEEAESDDDE